MLRAYRKIFQGELVPSTDQAEDLPSSDRIPAVVLAVVLRRLADRLEEICLGPHPALGFVSLEGFIQARERFCAGFAMAGVQNFGELGSHTSIEDDEALAADRRKAMRIHATAIAGGLIAGVAFGLLPL